MANEITIEILADGTIKCDTGAFTGPVHASAEQFFSVLQGVTGGDTARQVKRGSVEHSHAHAHGVEHSHE